MIKIVQDRHYAVMTKATATLILSLHASAAGAPEWIHVIPAGTFMGADGRGPFEVDAADLVSRFNAAGRRIPIDENHAIDLAGKVGHPSPARGWIVALESRADGVWGKVEWTEEGRDLVAGRAYGFLSPVFTHTRTKPQRVAALLRVALTNDPNLTDLTSLHSKENAMLEELRKLLGLPETADEAAAIAAITALHTAQAAHAADLGRIAEAAGAAKDANPDAIVTALQSRAVSGDQNLTALVVSLQSQLTTMQAENARQKSVQAVEDALKVGKIIPATREHWLTLHSKDPAGTDALLAAMPSINAGGVTKAPAEGGTTLSEEDRSVLAMMGLDEAAYAETAKSLAKTMGA